MRTFLKYVFYEVFCPILLFMGVDSLLRLASQNKRLIIMYHGVSRNNRNAINGRHLLVDRFEKHLIYFKKNFDIVPLEELCQMKLKGIRNRKHTIALTFDDGYQNNISNALSLLEKYQIPATFFISSEGLKESNNNYIQPSDYLDLINHSLKDTVEINGAKFRKGKYHLVDAANKKSSVYEFINSLDSSSFKRAFSDLRRRYPYAEVTANIDNDFYRVITRSELNKLRSSTLITVGSHGHSHINLVSLSEDDVRSELQISRDVFLECGVDTWYYLACPYGNFDGTTLAISRKLGYRFLIAGGSVEPGQSSEVFPRIGILNLASFAFNMLSVNRGFGRFGF